MSKSIQDYPGWIAPVVRQHLLDRLRDLEAEEAIRSALRAENASKAMEVDNA